MEKTGTVGTAYDAEMRFGVVMYGGVSLAIYIYGVSSEIFELARTTPIDGVSPPSDEPNATGEIYRRLSFLASDPELVRHYAALLRNRAQPSQDSWPELAKRLDALSNATRFVVDVISGTSAGGINGIFLAKALVNAQQFDSLGTLWVKEGDIGALLNDDKAWNGLPPGLRREGAPASLLSSDRMYLQLLKAFNEMPPLPGPRDGRSASPLVEELDLFVTTTDISGAPVPLRLFDKVVYERRHRQRFHFSYPSQIKTEQGAAAVVDYDFSKSNHPFLAFAARCTSSFPFAFEPMTLERMKQLSPKVTADQLALWKGYFDGLTALGIDGRAFGDGGYLDNKPFSYVAETLSQRFGDMPAQRKLIYVEPSPEPLKPEDDARPKAPNALQNALSALLSIPQYETIREDLATVLKRNRRIDRIERIARLAEEDVERQPQGFGRVKLPKGKVPAWKDLSLDQMLAYYGSGFAPYRRLRVYAVSDWLAEQVAAAFGIEAESDRAYALRAVVRAWRERFFTDNPERDDAALQPPRRSVNAFLQQHDLDYRLRRLSFMMRRVDQITHLLRRPNASSSELSTLLSGKLERAFRGMDAAQDAQVRDAALQQLRALKARWRTIYRQSMAMRRDWRNGAVVRSVVREDPQLQQELDSVLAMLLGQPLDQSGHVQQVRTVDGRRVDIPGDLGWLQSGPGNYSLQESVMHRVREWLKRAALQGQKPLKLWEVLGHALEATRIDEQGPNGASFKPLLFDVWNLIGQPQLLPQIVSKQAEGADASYEAVLHVLPNAAYAAGSLESEVSLRLNRLIGEWFLNFDSYDQTRYMLYFDTGTGEPASIDVVRISPEDACSLRAYRADKSKLAGTSLAHFGAFLDETWRLNDIMWGRLDGAERLIQSILPADDSDTDEVRKELIRLAHERILTQTLKRESALELTGWLVKALNEVPGNSAQDRLTQLLGALEVKPGPARDRLAAALTGLLDPQQLRQFASQQDTFDPQPPMERTLHNAARAVTITGRVLEGISEADAKAVLPVVRWTARVGLALQAAMVVAIPGTYGQRIFAHLLPLVYAVELLLVAIAFFFGESGLRFAALSAFGVTAMLHLGALLLRDAARHGHLLKSLATLVLCITALFAAFGALALYEQGRAAVCGAGATASPSSAIASCLCRFIK